MDIFAAAGHAMRMDAQAWSCHANPLSVFSRILGGSAVFLALWSVHWIGWFAVAPIGAAVLWIWLNPRLFPPPTHTEAWATRGVLGEREFLNRAAVPVPDHHRRAAWVTTAMALVCLLLTALAFIMGDFLAAFCAWHAATVAKLWFCDRMVWLWEEMKARHPVYEAWDRAEWSRDFG